MIPKLDMRVGQPLMPAWIPFLGALISGTSFAQIQAKVTLGADSCRQVEVPGVKWSPEVPVVDKDNIVVYRVLDELEFRVTTGGSELYFAAVSKPDYARVFGSSSKEKFALGIHNSGPVREIKHDAWAKAHPLVKFATQVLWEGIIGANDNKSASYAKKEFAKSGEHLALAVSSANNRWLAVFSYDGKQQESIAGSPGIPGRSKEPTLGVLYADVYNVSTGASAITISGPFQNIIPGNWFLTDYFLEDRYFVFNTTGPPAELTSGVRQFEICELPNPSKK